MAVWRRGLGLLLTVVLVAGVAACGVRNGGTQPDSDDGTDSSADDGTTTGVRIASSLSEYIRSLLADDDDHSMAETQRSTLERALEHEGRVSVADYESAWADYKQCVAGHGYSEPVLIKYDNGIYVTALREDDSSDDARRRKFLEDDAACFATHVLYVNAVYGMQVGNPELLVNTDQATVDCLIREDAVPVGYDAGQYKEDERLYLSEKGTPTLDFSDAVVRSCLAANGWPIGNGQAVWRPFDTPAN